MRGGQAQRRGAVHPVRRSARDRAGAGGLRMALSGEAGADANTTRLRCIESRSGPGSRRIARSTVLYLPGTNMNGEVARRRSALLVSGLSWPRMAWICGRWTIARISFRRATPASVIATDLRRWTQRTVRRRYRIGGGILILNRTKSDQIFVAGFSRGVELRLSVRARHPQAGRGIWRSSTVGFRRADRGRAAAAESLCRRCRRCASDL